MINNVTLSGNIGKDAEVRTLVTAKGNQTITSFSIAVFERFDKTTNEAISSWHYVDIWDYKGTQILKGDSVLVQGRISKEKYTKDGVEREVTKIVAHSVTFLDRVKNSKKAAESTAVAQTATAVAGNAEIGAGGDDLPF